jgi:flagellar FliJ protein
MTHALKTVLEQAEIERNAALARLQRADEALRAARAQHEQLLAYRDDYRRRAPALAGKAANIELVRCHQGFMQRLEQAVDQHRAQLHTLEQQAEVQREALLEREMRVAAVRKLIERRAQEQSHAVGRREQRHSDELAQRMAWAGRARRHEH